MGGDEAVWGIVLGVWASPVPELPEVETVRRDLVSLIAGKKISDVIIRDRRVLEGFGPRGGPRRAVRAGEFTRALVGRTVRDVLRRGKYLIFDVGEDLSFLAHLRMTGRLVVGPVAADARAHFAFEEMSQVLSFSDTRRFGELWLAKDWRRDPSIAALGPEPLDESFDASAWGRDLRRSGAKMQSALLDQKRMAGLGNIYVTEALFLSGIRPTRRARTLKSSQILPLIENIRRVLQEGLSHRGVSFRDYRDARGQRGQARDRLLVYGKAKSPCPRCNTLFRGLKVSGRGTVYCPKCQK
ncbi:MAG: bifunctional DNA-formamidopyrimidine glycosylase/DNA-(apurinic or apyrimidinic site) lyase [Elusimicrobia bacterium]|nr:bifunctional DNA-formamidopyrimidine glycosylase/DNA-(apurinic or apyrimidinic site) lyase [Elusimicrobiota bacterium]